MAMPNISVKNGVIPFKHPSLQGTIVQKMSHVIRNGYISPRALKLLSKRPELFINHCIFNLGHPIAEEYPKILELASKNGNLIVERRPSQDFGSDMIVEDGEFIFRTVEEAGKPLQKVPAIECRELPGSERALKINEIVFLGNLELDAKITGIRSYDENKPVFVPSFSLKSFDQLSRMMSFLKLEQMSGIDLGSGIGSFGFQAAGFFKDFTMIEIFKPIHKKAKQLCIQLKRDGIIANNINIVNDDFFSEHFDITPYSFVYLFKPIYENGDKLVELLKKTKPGTLILSELFNDPYYDSAFELVQMPPSLNTRCNARLFRRLP